MNDQKVEDIINLLGIIENNQKKEIDIPWSHGIYKCYYYVRRLFISPSKLKINRKEELDLLAQVRLLLETNQSNDKEVINKCGHFITLQRHIENTSARKRLERWAKNVITIYLIIVCILFLIHGKAFEVIGIKLSIDNSLMIALLSTTTINIIALGLIVLRGHFEHTKLEINKQENTKGLE